MLVGKHKFSGGTDGGAWRDWAMDSIFMGYIAIAVAIFFALRAFRIDIKGGLSTIKERIIPIQETAGSVWDVVKRSPILGATGTVERNLTNLGSIRITTEPHLAHY